MATNSTGLNVRVALSGMDSVKAQLRDFHGTVAGVAGKFKTIAAAAVGAITAGSLARAVREATEYADGLGKLSQQTGVAVKSLSSLSHAAALANVSQSELALGLRNLAQELVKSGRGASDMEQELLALADKFSGMADGPQKTSLAIEKLGRSGQALIPMLNRGSGEIRSLMDEARNLGLVVDNKTAAAAERFNDSLTRVQSLVKGTALTLVSELSPAMDKVAAAFENLSSKTNVGPMLGYSIAHPLKALQMAFGLPGAEGIAQGEVIKRLMGQFGNIGQSALGAIAGGGTGTGSTPASTEAFLKYRLLLNQSQQSLDTVLGGDRQTQLLKERLDLIKKLSDEMLAKKEFDAAAGMPEDELKAASEWQTKYNSLLKEQISIERELGEAEKARAQARKQIEAQMLAGSSEMFGSFANLAQSFGRKGFAAWKAMALSQAIVDTYRGATAAFAAVAGIPFAGPALATAAAAMAVASGLANVAVIARTAPPAFAEGGRPEVGRVAMVGERGPELFVPDSPGTIVPNHLLGSFGGGGRLSVAVFDDRTKMNDWLNTREGRAAVIDLVGQYQHTFA